MDENFGVRLKELSRRLEIKSSQQAAAEEYFNLIEILAEPQCTNSSEDVDAASICHRHTEKATEFSKKLAKIAYATSKFQAVLTEDQQKILHVLNFEWVMLNCRQQIHQ
jgi:hypothetical protein